MNIYVVMVAITLRNGALNKMILYTFTCKSLTTFKLCDCAENLRNVSVRQLLSHMTQHSYGYHVYNGRFTECKYFLKCKYLLW